MISTILCNKNTNMLPKHLIFNPQTQAGSIEPALVIMNTTALQPKSPSHQGIHKIIAALGLWRDPRGKGSPQQ